MGKSKAAYHLLALIVIAMWGVTFISTKVLIGAGLQPAQIFAMRFAVAYIGIWLLCALAARGRKALRGAEREGAASARTEREGTGSEKAEREGAASAGTERPSAARLYCGSVRDELLFVLLGITGGSIYFLTENTALVYTQACEVSFIVCSAPLLTALMTLLARRFLRGELVDGLEKVRLGWPLVVGTLLALGGMAAVLFDGAASVHEPAAGATASNRLLGDMMALAAALCWALYSILMAQMTTRHGALLATRKVFFYGLVTIIPFLFGEHLDHRVLAQPAVWGNLLFLSVVASLGCFVLWNKVMSKLGNVTSTNYVYLNPFFTLVGAVLILGEHMSLQAGLGSAAIVLGVVIGSGLGSRN